MEIWAVTQASPSGHHSITVVTKGQNNADYSRGTDNSFSGFSVQQQFHAVDNYAALVRQ